MLPGDLHTLVTSLRWSIGDSEFKDTTGLCRSSVVLGEIVTNQRFLPSATVFLHQNYVLQLNSLSTARAETIELATRESHWLICNTSSFTQNNQDC